MRNKYSENILKVFLLLVVLGSALQAQPYRAKLDSLWAEHKILLGQTTKGIELQAHGVTFIAASNASDIDTVLAQYVCDGTNDQVEIQAAIDAAGTGGIVVLSKGTFNVENAGSNRAMVIDGDNDDFELMGMGWGTKINLGSAENCRVIEVRENDRVRIANLYINGTGDTQTADPSSGISIRDATNVDVEGVYIFNVRNNSIEILGGNGHNIRACRLDSSTAGRGLKISWQDGTIDDEAYNIRFDNNFMRDHYLANVYLESCYNIGWDGNIFIANEPEDGGSGINQSFTIANDHTDSDTLFNLLGSNNIYLGGRDIELKGATGKVMFKNEFISQAVFVIDGADFEGHPDSGLVFISKNVTMHYVNGDGDSRPYNCGDDIEWPAYIYIDGGDITCSGATSRVFNLDGSPTKGGPRVRITNTVVRGNPAYTVYSNVNTGPVDILDCDFEGNDGAGANSIGIYGASDSLNVERTRLAYMKYGGQVRNTDQYWAYNTFEGATAGGDTALVFWGAGQSLSNRAEFNKFSGFSLELVDEKDPTPSRPTARVWRNRGEIGRTPANNDTLGASGFGRFVIEDSTYINDGYIIYLGDTLFFDTYSTPAYWSTNADGQTLWGGAAGAISFSPDIDGLNAPTPPSPPTHAFQFNMSSSGGNHMTGQANGASYFEWRDHWNGTYQDSSLSALGHNTNYKWAWLSLFGRSLTDAAAVSNYGGQSFMISHPWTTNGTIDDWIYYVDGSNYRSVHTPYNSIGDMYFENAAFTITMDVNTWDDVTNGTNDLWTEGDTLTTSYIDYVSDELVIQSGGGGPAKVEGFLSFENAGTGTNVWEIRVVQDGNAMRTFSVDTDDNLIHTVPFSFIYEFAALDEVGLQIRSTTDGDDATVQSASLTIIKL